jgi:hypothetical protein
MHAINEVEMFKRVRSLSWRNEGPDHEPYYDFWRPRILRCKIVLQMAIGVTIVLLLIIKAISHSPYLHNLLEVTLPIPTQLAWEHKTLEIVAKGLAYSAGVDLAYMLFTPGPDEAFEPVVLALASGVILLASEEAIKWEQSVGALLLSIAIGVVWAIKKKLFDARG